MNGGQWTQTRKAKLPDWQHGNLCQLCKEEVGTADHRHRCSSTCPAEGWPQTSPAAAKYINSLSPLRKSALANRAVLAVEISIPPPQEADNAWRWIIQPDDIHDQSLRWYIDGSRKFPRHYDLSTTGCGVVVVDAQDQLVGYASATPPRWCDSSAAAETWALHLTLKEVVIVPQIFTDCLGLVRIANRGFQAATSPKMANARIWKLIEDTLDGHMRPLREALVWIPAHTSVDQCCLRQRSDQRNMTAIDWRANQLADWLAKDAAPEGFARKMARTVIESAQEALVYSAATLGAVTYAANNTPEVVQRTGGTTSTVMRRDSTSLQLNSRAAAAPRTACHSRKRKTPPQVCPPSWVSAPAQPVFLERTQRQEKSASARVCTLKRRRAEEEALQAAVSSTASRLVINTSQPPAAARLAALRERVRQRAEAADAPM